MAYKKGAKSLLDFKTLHLFDLYNGERRAAPLIGKGAGRQILGIA